MARIRAEIDDSKIEEVIDGLASEKPITKKRACEILGIAYNTARLDTIINDYMERKARLVRRRKQNQGKPLSVDEMKTIVEAVLAREPISDLSEQLARSPALIKSFIDKSGLPVKDPSCDYFKPPVLAEALVKEDHIIGSIVYSAQHQQIAEVIRRITGKDGETVYSIWLSEDMQYAYTPWYELADMSLFITEYKANIKIQKLDTPASMQIMEALRKSKLLKGQS